jgi:hypothetical protein
MSNLNDPDFRHLKRLGIIIVLLVIGFALLKIYFTPKDFGKFGHYRPSSLAENMSRPQNYADISLCQACHDGVSSTWKDHRHKTVNCQTCHGALLKHTEDPTAIKPVKPAGRKFCLLCHEKNITRPKTFPQVHPRQHNPGLNCFSCHNPHSPRLP